MEDSVFDPSAFLDATTTEAATRRPPLPAGAEFIGTVGEPKPRTWQGKKDPSQSGIALDVPVEIDLSAYPDVQTQLGGVEKVTLIGGIMLDMTPDKKSIDFSPGKNGTLRRWREALNMNLPGEAFSFRMMQGRLIRVKVKHEPYEGELYDKIDSVARP